ncbi:type II TA system antitoxin MqsA family protein [Lactobacillus gallinarum]|uniref:type II TA system antitoxin MqsA family protein n=1 Tax=Lactobacillus gallinarum TaxID=52242 RepID=UPI0019597455|nr:type II TA system antitoxin MqsA family protein [Lactobacillus gallinarum]MBM6973502.1 DUF4065 domain-containing protein [Lactobacillus gallinarum]
MSKLIKKVFLDNCPVCDQAHEVKEFEDDAQVIIKGEQITYKERYFYCENADIDESEFIPARMANKNLLAARDNYRKKHHLLTSRDIVDLRKDYDLSQVELARLLGWGEATISRYESKAIQDESHDMMLQLIRKDPLTILDLLERNSSKFTDSEKKAIQNKVEQNLESYGRENLSRQNLTSNYVGYLDPSDQNGQTSLNIDKIEAVISYIASRVNNLHKVKLMKLLWYIDSISVKQTGQAITGLVYRHEEMGALPIGHRNLVALNNVNTREELSNNGYEMIHFYPSDKVKMSVLTKADKKILDTVIKKFKDFNAKSIIDYMHQEIAYKETKPNEIITFNLAKKLREF